MMKVTATKWFGARAAIVAILAIVSLTSRTLSAQVIFNVPTLSPTVETNFTSDAYRASALPELVAQEEVGLAGMVAFEDSDTVETPSRWDRVCRRLPQGMIPYVGPRTPEDQKDRGLGLPLVGRGWRSQPFSISTFAGVTNGDPLISGRVYQNTSFYGGLNFSWDYDHYWGIEKRLGFGALNLTDGGGRTLPDTGLSVTGEYRLMYYPWGDSRWRPFVTAGVGWSDIYFQNDRGATHLDTVGMIPFGLGIKYLSTERLALRVDLVDEFTFGTEELTNFHYVALTAGIEFRYGRRLLKMPWHCNPPG
jgi:hypothetical protein